jgi:hypothetical protein
MLPANNIMCIEQLRLAMNASHRLTRRLRYDAAWQQSNITWQVVSAKWIERIGRGGKRGAHRRDTHTGIRPRRCSEVALPSALRECRHRGGAASAESVEGHSHFFHLKNK